MAFGAAGIKMNEEYFLRRIDNNIELCEQELQCLVVWFGIETSFGEEHRWQKEAKTIVKLNDRYFAVDWYQGLTELQDNGFYDQPYEVELKEYQKTITVRDWIRVK